MACARYPYDTNLNEPIQTNTNTGNEHGHIISSPIIKNPLMIRLKRNFYYNLCVYNV